MGHGAWLHGKIANEGTVAYQSPVYCSMFWTLLM